jgi:eukaryotic-like serine/threonine-protein kinase
MRKAATACILFLAGTASATELEGWWIAEARHAGQATPVYLHFLRDAGKPAARLSLPVLDAWDFPIGPYKEGADQVELTSVGWSIAVDARTPALVGVLPKELVPVHQIPVTFHKVKPPVIPGSAKWSAHSRPKVLWSREAGGAVWAGLALDPDHHSLLVGNDAGSLIALDSRSGAHRWSLATGGKVRATPTLTGRSVYVTSDDGHLYKLDRRTGRKVWKSKIDASAVPRVPSFEPNSKFDRYASAAVERDGRVYVGARDGGVCALDAASGRTLWRFATGDLVMATPTVRGDLVLVGSFDKHVYALDSASGALRWKRELGGVVPADVVVADGRALVGTRAYDFLALDLTTGEPLWDQYVWFSWIESVPVVRKGLAYVGSSDALRLFAFDVGSGARAWESRIPGYGWSKPALAGDEVVIGTVGTAGGIGPREGAVVAVDHKTGEVRWLHSAVKPEGAREWGFASSVVAGPAPKAPGQVIYAADLHGRVIALLHE